MQRVLDVKLIQILSAVTNSLTAKDPQLKKQIEAMIEAWFSSKHGTPAERREFADIAMAFGVTAPKDWEK